MIDIKKLGIHKTNALHECIQGYIKQPKRTPNRKTDEDFLIICQLFEKLQIAECDEVWIFNNGENFIDFGRVANNVRSCKKNFWWLVKVSD